MKETQLEQTVRLYGKDILRFCRITTGSVEEGDELYQDTMLTLLEKQEKLDPGQSIKSYAVAVSLRLWKNRRRKTARRLRLAPQQSLEDLQAQGGQPGTAEGTSPEEIVMRKSQLYLVRRLVEQLPEQYRLPLQMYYSADLPVKAIAQILKLPENTVKSRLHRAKVTIRRKLEEMEYDTAAI